MCEITIKVYKSKRQTPVAPAPSRPPSHAAPPKLGFELLMDEPGEIIKDMNNLSMGASNVLDRFLHMASDYIKQAKGEKEQDLAGNNRKTKLTPQVSCTQM